ncbi:MAG: 30S ribosome-binding factor RbfA [Clostridia bacterium]|jgi:ribosome-binding factor A|nr:30S ribosome-binding factor RbfA [Clostridia bacterium]
MTSHRTARISEEIKRELALMIQEEIKDPRVKGLLSITHADVTNDLRYAKVFVSVLSEEDRASVLQGLEKAQGYLRSELAKRLRLRYTPELLFKLDDSIAYGSKINKIISGFKNGAEEG